MTSLFWIGLGALRQSVLAYYVHAPDDQMPLLMSLRQTLSKAVSSVGSEDGGEVWGAHPEPREAGTDQRYPKMIKMWTTWSHQSVKSAEPIGVGNWLQI